MDGHHRDDDHGDHGDGAAYFPFAIWRSMNLMQPRQVSLPNKKKKKERKKKPQPSNRANKKKNL